MTAYNNNFSNCVKAPCVERKEYFYMDQYNNNQNMQNMQNPQNTQPGPQSDRPYQTQVYLTNIVDETGVVERFIIFDNAITKADVTFTESDGVDKAGNPVKDLRANVRTRMSGVAKYLQDCGFKVYPKEDGTVFMNSTAWNGSAKFLRGVFNKHPNERVRFIFCGVISNHEWQSKVDGSKRVRAQVKIVKAWTAGYYPIQPKTSADGAPAGNAPAGSAPAGYAPAGAMPAGGAPAGYAPADAVPEAFPQDDSTVWSDVDDSDVPF